MLKKCTNLECTNPDGPMLPLSEFSKDKSAKDGRVSRCKLCVRRATSKHYYATRRVAALCREWTPRKYANWDNFYIKKKCSNPTCKQPIKNVKEFNKCKASSDGLQWHCKPCGSTSGKERTINKPEMVSAYNKQSSIKNKDRNAKRSKGWRTENPDKNAAKSMRGHVAKLQRSVPWANKERIEKMYWVAKILTERTGIKWAVDHIVPLRGKNVSGLHVENNLQVITNSRNVRKKNKFTPVWGLA